MSAERDSLIEPCCYGYCGDLGWTVRQHGRVTHKQSCPRRVEPWCQTHPDGCPDDCKPLASSQTTEPNELGEARQALWDCFKFAGGDTDGDAEPHMETKYLAAAAVDAVRDLRSEYDEALQHG